MENSKLELYDYLAILKRRIWFLVIPTILIVALAVPIILVIPPLYRSTATILIEDQAIPADLVRSTVSTFAAERLEVITQRVTTTQNLIDLINKLDLYRDRRARETMTELAEHMRKSFKMKLVEANVANSPTGKATIAFTLSFEHRSAEKAQAIVNELVSLYIAENLRARRQNAEETKRFLEQEVQRVSDQIATLETNLARFKEENAAVLPEQIKIVMSAYDRASQQALANQRRVEVLQERKIYLEANLVQIDPYLRVDTIANKDDLRPEERLKKLRSELLQLRARYGPGHPDVLRLTRQINMLAKEVPADKSGRPEDLAVAKRELASAKKELTDAQRKYSESHPDVVRLHKRVAVLEKAIRDAGGDTTDVEKGRPNPAYLQVKADIAATDAEIRSLQEQEKVLRQQIKALEAQVGRAPQVEREYGILQRNLEGAIATQRELAGKLRQARLGELLELERKSERFSLIEPASRAKEPSSPNRPVYILVAFVLALGVGAASAAGSEAADKSIHSPKQLAALTGVAPLVVIPNLATPTQRQRRRNRRLFLLVALIALLAVGAYLVLVKEIFGPLDVLRARIENQIDIWLTRIQ